MSHDHSVGSFDGTCGENCEDSDIPDNEVIHLDDDVSVNQNHLFQATYTILPSVTSTNEESIVENCLQNQEDEDIPPSSDINTDIVHQNCTDMLLEIFSSLRSDSVESVIFEDFGQPDCICKDCGSHMWYGERTRKDCKPIVQEFSMCCREGRIKITHRCLNLSLICITLTIEEASTLWKIFDLLTVSLPSHQWVARLTAL